MYNKFILIFTFLFSLVLHFQINAAPGDLDLSFGTNGKVFAEGFNGIEFLRIGTAIQPDGKILAASSNYTGTSVNIGVVRLNPNGTFDSSFGNSGYFQTSFGGFLSVGSAVAVQPDGKIIVGGAANVGSSSDANFALLRLNSNGTIDNSFGINGRITANFTDGFNEFIQNLVIQPDGKIIAVGTSINSDETQSFFAAARFNTNGFLDSTFDTDGKVTLTASNRPLNSCSGVALDSSGKIVLGGGVSELTLAEAEFAFIRLKSNGSLDTTFDNDGKVQVPVVGETETVQDLKIQSDGKIVGVGYSDTDLVGGGNDDFAVVRLNSNGSPDTSFSNDGKTTFSFNPQNEIEQAWGVVIQSNNKIVVSGASGRADPTGQVPILNSNFATVRFNANGSVDNSFGNNGGVVTTFSTPVNIGFGNTLQSDGKILHVGYTGDTDPETLNSRITIIRHLGDEVTQTISRPIFDFDGDSKTDISIFRPSVGEWWYLRSSNSSNSAVQFGLSSDKPVPADFTGDGKTDIAFWRESTGEWFILRSEDSSFLAFPLGSAGDIPITGYFDSDNKADVGVFRPSQSTWYIQKSTGGVDIVNFGIAEDKPIVADYDGDQRDDIAIFRPSVQEWWILKSSNGGVSAVQFGQAGDITTPGDYTGDGKADIAFWRPSSGEWFVLRSEDNSFFAFPFGSNGDIPTAGDYDGDGLMDSAVFRPSNTTWFLNTTNGVQTVPFGLSTDVPLPSVFNRP